MAQNVVPVTLGSPRFNRRDLGSLRVTEAVFPPEAELPLHGHERPIMAVILEGSWDERISGRLYDCLPGSVLIEPAEERHINRFHEAGARVLIVEPDVSRFELYRPCARLLGEVGCFDDWGVAALGRRVVAELGSSDDISGLAIEGLILEMLAHAARKPRLPGGPATPAWFTRVRERLHAEFSRSLRLSDLADTAGVHPIHLARAFRHKTGMSVGTYQRRLRLDWCADRLAHTTTALAEIALRAGFADQSHFTRTFRRYTGLTPRAYRAARNGRAS
jgi:AraC family transcriptional regulator